MTTTPVPQPIYLFAGSELLFWKTDSGLFIEAIRRAIDEEAPKAAYIGASNGDAPEFYSIFEAAMDGIGVSARRMIHASFPAEEREFLRQARIVLLAGGDVERGWNVFTETGMKDEILNCYRSGAVLIGVSAGAMQLGQHALVEHGESSHQLIDSFQLVPFVLDVHDEQRDWSGLSSTIRLLEGTTVGIGIPTGGGMVFHPDQTVEAVRRPLHEFRVDNETLKRSLLMPSEAQPEATRS
jgi:cyanophycinase